jgi:hypothetical protein
LEDWAKGFACPRASQASRTQSRFWTWSMTRDAANVTTNLDSTNVLRTHGGLALHKAYNVSKNLFSTPFRGYMPLDNTGFESLAFSDDLREQWYHMNSQQGPTTSSKALRESFRQTKTRLLAAFEAPCSPSATRHWGVRQEYRINIAVFRALPLDSHPLCLAPRDSAARPVQLTPLSTPTPATFLNRLTRMINPSTAEQCEPHPSHLPFWVLRTTDVMNFAARELGRWLLAAETLFYRPSAAVSASRQMLNAKVVATLLRSARFSLSALCAPEHPTFWRTTLKQPKGKRRRHIPDDSASSGEEDIAPPKEGLGYQDCLETFGMLWLPSGKFNWLPLPSNTTQTLERLGPIHNTLQANLRSGAQIEDRIEFELAVNEYFRERVSGYQSTSHQVLNATRREDLLQLGAELIVAGFVCEVWQILARRKFGGHGTSPDQVKDITQPLTADEGLGLHGLTYKMLSRVLKHPPRIARALEPTTAQTNRNGSDRILATFNTGRWRDRVHGLFAPQPAGEKPHWRTRPFRKRQDQFCEIVLAAFGENTLAEFRLKIAEVATYNLWIIPQYTNTALSRQAQPIKKQTSDPSETETGPSPFARINWNIPKLPDRDTRRVKTSTHQLDDDDLTPRRRRAHTAICHPDLPILSAKGKREMEVDSDDDDAAAAFQLTKDPQDLGLEFRLDLAAEALEAIPGSGYS